MICQDHTANLNSTFNGELLVRIQPEAFMKDNGVPFLAVALFGLIIVCGITYLDNRFAAYHDRRCNEVYKEGMSAASAGVDYNMNPYYDSSKFYVEWKRGYNAGLIEKVK